MENSAIIEQKKLVHDIHIGIQEAFHKGAIRFMSSCLIEVLNTAFGRFVELGICSSQAYESQQGGKMIYLQSVTDKKPLIEKFVNLLSDLSSARNEKHMQLIENLVSEISYSPLAKL